MHFSVYKIKSASLIPYIQYVLFNRCENKQYTSVIRSFANNNYCLGIINDQRLVRDNDDAFSLQPKTGIHSYLTGVYLKPYDFIVKGVQDEICIDFTPSGFYHFFKFPAKTYMLNDDVLSESFGKESHSFFYSVFEIKDSEIRGRMIETYLQKKLLAFASATLEEALHLIHRTSGCISVGTMAKSLGSSEKKLYRLFSTYFDVGPKDYIRVTRFRAALNILKYNPKKTAALAYDLEFSDQSHFIRELKFFSGSTPAKLWKAIYSIEDSVHIEIK